MKTQLMRLAASLMIALPMTAFAGADEPLEPAPVYDEILNQISMREA